MSMGRASVHAGLVRTLRDGLGIRRSGRQLDAAATSESGSGNQAGRDGDNIADARELSTPPVRAEELHKLCRGIQSEFRLTRAGFQGLICGAFLKKSQVH
jgi:hypothetical protein